MCALQRQMACGCAQLPQSRDMDRHAECTIVTRCCELQACTTAPCLQPVMPTIEGNAVLHCFRQDRCSTIGSSKRIPPALCNCNLPHTTSERDHFHISLSAVSSQCCQTSQTHTAACKAASNTLFEMGSCFTLNVTWSLYVLEGSWKTSDAAADGGPVILLR